MSAIKRRTFMQGAVLGSLAFSVGGVEVLLTPEQARAQGLPLKVLSQDEATSLEAVAEALVPGARAAGIANFIDQQCSVPPHEALLTLRMADGKPPFINFYRAALKEIDRQCVAKHGAAFATLTAEQQHDVLNLLRQGKHEGWQGPGQGLVYGTLRNDGVDVVYGTVEGFERLGVPYMPHILPTKRW
jgi:hypothetical protein